MALTRVEQLDRAWSLVAVAFVITLFSAGLRLAVGPFVSSLISDFGFSHTYLSGVVATGMMTYGVGLVAAGRLADLWGARRMAAGGSIVLGISLAVAGMTRSPLVFALFFAVFASAGFAATSQPVLTTVISRWFVKRRGLAMTVLSSGTMGGIAIMTPLSAGLIALLGWRDTFLAYALFSLFVMLPAAWWGCQEAAGVATHQPALATGQGAKASGPIAGGDAPWHAALRTSPFWYLALGFFSCGFSMNMLGTHGVPMLELHGFSTMTAAFGIGLIGLVSIFGTVGLGWLSDRFGRRNMLALVYLVRGVGFLGVIFARDAWVLYAVAAIGGLAWGGSSAFTSAITADVYGTRWVGTLFGWIYLSHQIGAASGTYLGGWGYVTYGSYTMAFVVAVVTLFMATALSLQLPGRPYRPAQVATATGV